MNFDGYCVRVQALEDYKHRVENLAVNPDYQAIIAVKHFGTKGENEHYHIVIKTSVRDQAFRVRMKKVFDKAKGNEHMSIKPWDGNIDAISYLFHEDEKAEIIARHNVTDETITKARERNREVQKKIEKAKSRASWTIEEELLENYRTRIDKELKYMSVPTIAMDIVLHALRHDKYVPNDYQLRAMASKIQFKLFDGDVSKENKFAIDYVAKVFRMNDDERYEWIHLHGGGIPLR